MTIAAYIRFLHNLLKLLARPEEIRTSDPQIRSLDRPLSRASQLRELQDLPMIGQENGQATNSRIKTCNNNVSYGHSLRHCIGIYA